MHLIAVTERAPDEDAARRAWFRTTVLKGDEQSKSPNMTLSFDVIGAPRLLGKDKAIGGGGC